MLGTSAFFLVQVVLGAAGVAVVVGRGGVEGPVEEVTGSLSDSESSSEYSSYSDDELGAGGREICGVGCSDVNGFEEEGCSDADGIDGVSASLGGSCG